MPFVAGSLEDVEAWAEHDFPVLFAAVTTFVLADLFDTHDFDGEYLDGKVILQPILISALQVGTTTAGHTVYACITGNNDVELFSGHEVVSPKDAKQLIWYIKPVADLDDVTLDEPFCYPIKTAHPASIDRLETIIRYFFLRNDETSAVAQKLCFFKAHFRAVCRDVARGTGAVTEGDEMDGDDTLPDGSPPGLVEDTDVGRLRDNPAATSIFNEHVHAMDESYHDFKIRMLRQLGAMQAIDRDNTVQLQAQNQDLERRLGVSEQGRAKLEKELEAEQARSKTATEEAKNWKAQYEGLKGTLQDALGQRF